jgi:hypothetical protein
LWSSLEGEVPTLPWSSGAALDFPKGQNLAEQESPCTRAAAVLDPRAERDPAVFWMDPLSRSLDNTEQQFVGVSSGIVVRNLGSGPIVVANSLVATAAKDPSRSGDGE